MNGEIGHLRELAKQYPLALRSQSAHTTVDIASAFLEAIEVLDPTAFAPEARADFLIRRKEIRRIVEANRSHSLNSLGGALEEMLELLDKYGPLATTRRTFRWMLDAKLRDIVERDYAELVSSLAVGAAWKSTVVMAGSIAEAILFDLIVNDPGRLRAAQKSAQWPADKGGKALKPKDLKLFDLLRLAVDVGVLPKDREETFDRLLRDYRNFIHPNVELRNQHPCGEGEAYMARGAVIALCDHFDRQFP